MNITIFGGTGPAGLLTIQKALSLGHQVTAYARTPAKITIKHEQLTIIKGEMNEADKIEKAIIGADAVISLLGPNLKFKALEIANGYKSIIASMQKNGPKRLIAAVSSSYRDPEDRYQFMVEFGVWIIRLLAPKILRDIITMGELIRGSKLDWTMIRVPALKNKPAEGNLHIGYTGDGKFNFFKLTREDLADFVLQQLESAAYLRKAPAVSN